MLRDRTILGRATSTFTLQWHLTNDCTQCCAHCYDRTTRAVLSPEAALEILHGFVQFCHTRHVQPRVSLSGGDPLLYPGFHDLYHKLATLHIPTSILGNPLSAQTLKEIIAIRRPGYYQVSLEGFEATNDSIRGPGSYRRTVEFLETARELRVATHVMLTLSRANLSEAIPLGIALAPLARKFTFNRLARVGAGSAMLQPSRSEFRDFLVCYLAAARQHPALGLKENLLCIAVGNSAPRFLSGCTGFGCGAAFNFVALLPDGEVHACRKFPSLIGQLPQMSWSQIYDSAEARAYRNGSRGCRGCRMKKICGGCLAFTHGEGLDPLVSRDPFCFRDETA